MASPFLPVDYPNRSLSNLNYPYFNFCFCWYRIICHAIFISNQDKIIVPPQILTFNAFRILTNKRDGNFVTRMKSR